MFKKNISILKIAFFSRLRFLLCVFTAAQQRVSRLEWEAYVGDFFVGFEFSSIFENFLLSRKFSLEWKMSQKF